MFPFSPYNDFLCLVLPEAFLNKILQLALQSWQQGRRAGPLLLFDWTSTALSKRLLQVLDPRISLRLLSFKLVSHMHLEHVLKVHERDFQTFISPNSAASSVPKLSIELLETFKEAHSHRPSCCRLGPDPRGSQRGLPQYWSFSLFFWSQAPNFLMYKTTRCLGHFTCGNFSNFSKSGVRDNCVWLQGLL